MEQHIGWIGALSLYAGIGIAYLLNKFVLVKGGVKTMIVALLVFFGGIGLIVLGSVTNMLWLVPVGICAMACEYAWAQFRALDLACDDGKYKQD